MPRVLFYVKCRPQGADVWPIAEKERRVFIGYPLSKVAGAKWDSWRKGGIRSILADLRASDFEAIAAVPKRPGYKGQVTSNRRLAVSVEPGSIVLVPRVESGVCYAGEVSGYFELVDHPTWGDAYLDLRKKAGLKVDPEYSYIGAVVQTWPVTRWHTLVFPALPIWISYRLLSRNTVGVIRDLDDPKISALETVQDLMALPPGKQYASTQGQQNLEQALLTWLTPTSFEHLVVDLLRLEAPDCVYWHHVGGSGDGGADGIAVDTEGTLRAVLQCKWQYDRGPDVLAKSIRAWSGNDVQIVVAILHGKQNVDAEKSGLTFWNRAQIAALLKKHAGRLPISRTFGL